MKYLFFACAILMGGYTMAIAQDTTTDLPAFFKQRLTSDTGPPSYEALLKVIDTIPALDQQTIERSANKNGVEQFVKVTMDPGVHARTLRLIGLNHVSSAGINNFFIQSLGDADSNVKIAAISVARQLGPHAWTQASPILTKLATSATEDPKVKIAARKEKFRIIPINLLGQGNQPMID